ncbi:hypothetical protein, partial [Microcoleus sp. herbarium5]|uniref:hypothetical protein n=1 Tax=Microcoleus sp. herbarium5 TaxID=3055434 RepID=UPI002FD0582B
DDNSRFIEERNDGKLSRSVLAVEEATTSLTLIILKKRMKKLGMERQNDTSWPEVSASKEGKCGEKTPSTIDDAP